MSDKRYSGNIISSTPVEPSGSLQTDAASGVWSLAEANAYTKAGLWPTAGNLLYALAVTATKLVVLDVTDPNNITVLGTTAANAEPARDLVYDSVNQVAYVGNAAAGSDLVSYDVSDPENPAKISDFARADSDDIRALALSSDGTVLYAQSFVDQNFMTIDVSDPAAMAQLSDLAVAGGSTEYGVKLDEDAGLCVITLAAQNTIRVIDVSNPSSISEVGNYTSASEADNCRDLFLDTTNKVAFVLAFDDDELSAFNYDTGGNPTFIASVNFAPSGGTAVYYHMVYDDTNQIMYIAINAASGNNAVAAIDVSDASSMSLLQMFESSALESNPNGIALLNNNTRLMLSTNNDTVTLDVSDPTNMVVIGDQAIADDYRTITEYFAS